MWALSAPYSSLLHCTLVSLQNTGHCLSCALSLVASELQQSVFQGEGSRHAISLTFPRSQTLNESGLLLAVFTSESQVSTGTTYTAESYTEWVIERIGIPSTQKPEAESLSSGATEQQS